MGSALMCNRSLYRPLTPFEAQIIFMVSRGSVASRLHPCLPSYVPDGTQVPWACRPQMARQRFGFVALLNDANA